MEIAVLLLAGALLAMAFAHMRHLRWHIEQEEQDAHDHDR
jgi:hypothetical protein